jgi:alkanesulfonate monooxygenase SsuD/methylene tetrahydromethanopterin reductase-like flavin-dependent oxidoreductase (luciferase family)
VWFTEHHFVDDGYLPSALTLAAAVAARTSRIRIGTNLLLLPLHDPLRVAEDAATIGIISDGRFTLGVGLGYREDEYAAFGRDLRHRPSLLEESITILRRAWSGEPIDFEGKRFRVPAVAVRPLPRRPVPLFLGGLSPVAVGRAGRLADGYLSINGELGATYLDALGEAGRDPAAGRISRLHNAIIDEDPERTWAAVGPHALHQINDYVSWGSFGPDARPFDSPDDLIKAGMYRLWDAETAAGEFAALLGRCHQFEDVQLWAQLPGESVDSGSRRIEYLVNQVAPRTAALMERAGVASA